MTSEQASLFQPIDKPKTATDLLKDLESYKMNQMSKSEIQKRWSGHAWSSQELTLWARWQFRENVK